MVIKKMFKKKNKELSKKIMAIIVLPIFLVQMLSINLAFINMANAIENEEKVLVEDPKEEIIVEEETGVEEIDEAGEGESEEPANSEEEEEATSDQEEADSQEESDGQNEEGDESAEDVSGEADETDEPEQESDEAEPAVENTETSEETEEAEGENTDSSEDSEGADNSEDEKDEAKEPSWEKDGNKMIIGPVQENETYEAPQNEKVTVTFTKLPDNPGNLTIEEITLTEDQKEELGALSDKAYDITSDMKNGTFEYDLTLPKPKNEKNVEVKFAKDVDGLKKSEIVPSEDIEMESEEVNVELDHMTVFVVAETFDSTHGDGRIVEVSENDKLASSDNEYFESDKKWNKVNYNKNKFIEFRFSPNIPEESTLSPSVNLIFEYKRESLAARNNNHKARLLIENQATSEWDILDDDIRINNSDTDETFQIVIPSEYVDTIEEINNIKIRFQFAGKGEPSESGIKTKHDYVALEFDYQEPDNTSPTEPVLTWPIDGEIINDNSPLMQWEDSSDDSGIAGYYYRIYYNCSEENNIPDSCSSLYPNETGVFRASSEYQAGATPDGTYYWQVKAKDNADNYSEWSELEEFTIDTHAPEKLTITKPGDGDYFTTTPIRNEWTSTTDSSGIKEYRIEYVYDDGHSFSNMPYRTTTNTWRNHTPGISEQGGVTIRVQAIDNAGNEGEWSDPVHYFYDATAPAVPTGIYFKDTVNNKNVSCGEFTSARNFDVYWDANTEDDFDYYEYISFNADGSTGPIRTFTEPYFNASWWTVPIEGTYGVQIRAVDKAGNKSAWFGGTQGRDNSCKYTADWTKPTTPVINGFLNPDLSCGSVTNIKNITVDWSDSTDNIGVVGYDYHINYPLVNSSDRGDWNTSFTDSQYSGSLNEGIHNIEVRAKDAAGNVSEWSNICSITYDSISPDAPTLIAPENNSFKKGFPLLVTSWNTVSGAEKYIYESYHNEGATNLRWHEEFTTNSKSASNVSNATFWWRVKAVDAAGNESEWSDLWKVTVDNDSPEKPTGLKRFSKDGTKEYACGDIAQRQTLIPTWDDMAVSDSSFDHYEYVSFKPDGNIGTTKDLFVNEFSHNWVPTENGTNGYVVRSVDKAGNVSDWALSEKTLEGSCQITYDSTSPFVEITNPTADLLTGDVEVQGTVTDEHPHHYWLHITRDGSQIVNKVVNRSDSFTDELLHTLTQDGDYVVTLAARDAVGGTSSSGNRSADIVKSFTIDNTDPTTPADIRILNSEGDDLGCEGFTNQRRITVDWADSSDENFSHYDYMIKEGNIIDHPTVSEKTGDIRDEDGYYKYQVRAVDKVGNTSEWTGWCVVTLDRVSPLLANKTSFSGWYNSAQTSVFQYADDNMEDGYVDLTCEINTEGENQTCLVTPNVCDKAGNCNTTEVTSNGANIDFTKPVSTIDGGENNEKVYSNSWDGNISGTASDDLSGVKGVKISIQNDSGEYWNGSSWQNDEILVDAQGQENWNYILSSPEEGEYKIKSHAVDNAGNMENTYSLTIVLDKTIPEVDLSINPVDPNGDNDWYNSNPDVTLKATDNFALERIEYQINSQSGSWIVYNSPVNIPDGKHVFYYRSLDKAGNYSEIGIKNIKVDTINPDTVKDLDAYYDDERDAIKIKWSVEDSDIDKVYVYRGSKKSFSKNSGSKIAENDENDDDISDRDVEAGEKYYYKIVSRDEAGNKSDTRNISAEVSEDGQSAIFVDEGLELSGENVVSVGPDENGAEEESIGGGPDEQVQGVGTEEAGAVAGEEATCKSWPLWFWILALIIFTALSFLSTKNTEEEKAKSHFIWQLIAVGLMIILWYLFDKCPYYKWFPISVIVIGILNHLYYQKYKSRKKVIKEETQE